MDEIIQNMITSINVEEESKPIIFEAANIQTEKKFPVK